MRATIERKLNECRRDAQIGFYLTLIASRDSENDGTQPQLKTADDLYHYLLLDVLVSQEVATSPVACAIASLQQYITGILANMEPGYQSAVIEPDQVESWRTAMHDYQSWASNERVHYFPSAYLDPSLRQNRTESFAKLESDLNQSQLSVESVENAVLAYLSRLEELANLKTVNGYIDGTDFTQSTYYFIAKSRNADKWYWRSLDMSQRPWVPGSLTQQYHTPEPHAWSDWHSLDLPVSKSTIEHTVRPVFFNNRLYVVWAECVIQDHPVKNSDSTNANNNPLFRLNMCFKKYDGTWSPPTTCQHAYANHAELQTMSVQQILDNTQIIAVHDQSKASLSISLFVIGATSIKETAGFLFWMSASFDMDAVSTQLTRVEGLGNDDKNLQTFAQLYPPGERSKMQFTYVADSETTDAPCIESQRHESLGTAEYLKFANTADASGNFPAKRDPLRLNITFARHLIQLAETSMDKLLSWSSQHLQEPPLEGNSAPATLDFYGAYGRYFVELFLYVPWLIAHRFNQERQYANAERWLQYLFNPARKKTAKGSPDYWNAVPLISSTPAPGQLSYAIQGPLDPHRIALSHPVHFRKALYMLHIDILLNRGDASYRKLTRDDLTQAKLWYIRAADLLGPCPDFKQTDAWRQVTLKAFGTETNTGLRTFEAKLHAEGRYEASSEIPQQIPDVCVRPFAPAPSIFTIDTPHLRLPFNPVLISHWAKLESRLHNLRHNLDIVGRPLNLALFAAADDSRAPLGSNPQKATDPGNVKNFDVLIPPYRFSTMYAHAMSAVETVIQFGTTLLSFIERSEQAHYQELQHHHAWDLANLAVDLHTQALKIDQKSREALLASKAIVTRRRDYYSALVDEVINPEEALAAAFHLSGRIIEAGAHAAQATGHLLKIPPNIFGLADGGHRLEGGPMAASSFAMGASAAAHGTGEALERAAQYRRRFQEWTLARDQAELEMAQIDAQLALESEKALASQLQLRQTRTALDQARTAYDFFSKRFSNSQLYQWFCYQLSAFYYQVYDSTLALCRFTENSWRYEMADDSSPSLFEHLAWNTTYRGLAPGERIKLALLKMKNAYLLGNERELEIRKTVSLRRLKVNEDSLQTQPESINKSWDDIKSLSPEAAPIAGIKSELVKNGSCEFELKQQLFDSDYPGHCLRRIKSISVSLPAVVGPYEDIRATLTQLSSEVVMPGDGKTVLKQLRLNQQIALSTGVDDNGLFTLSFQDERYLPFEYTGAVSKWKLSFPNHASQKSMLESLTDIIVHVRYTARDGRLEQ